MIDMVKKGCDFTALCELCASVRNKLLLSFVPGTPRGGLNRNRALNRNHDSDLNLSVNATGPSHAEDAE